MKIFAHGIFLTCLDLPLHVFAYSHCFFGYAKIVVSPRLTSQIRRQHLKRCAVKKPVYTVLHVDIASVVRELEVHCL